MLLFMTFYTEEKKEKFETLYNKYKHLLFKYSYDILKDTQLAEDAVQESFVKIFKNLHKLNEDSTKTTNFVITIVKNISITMYNKKNKHNLVLFDDTEDTIEDETKLEEDTIASLNYDYLIEIIGELKEELKQPFLLRYVNEYSDEEIAQILGISKNNVCVRINRAKNKLKKLLKERSIEYEK